ncbi:MAG: PRC-barrel domain-containing protein [Acidimicrobiales bacterium]|nr:PRC-barrel domain-containing protein [Acidimicrobiales bacterium]
MSEYRVGATVIGADGELGKLDALIIDPTTHTVTHLVVSHDRLAPRLLVPVSVVTSANPDRIEVALDEAGLHQCDRFDEPNYKTPEGELEYGDIVLDPGSYFLEPFASPLDGWVLTSHERVPKGEVTIRRGADVYSSDGTKIGHVDEFLVDPADGHITHVVVREGILARKDVVIPLGNTSVVADERVVLDLDIGQVNELPKIPVRRHGHVKAD